MEGRREQDGRYSEPDGRYSEPDGCNCGRGDYEDHRMGCPCYRGYGMSSQKAKVSVQSIVMWLLTLMPFVSYDDLPIEVKETFASLWYEMYQSEASCLPPYYFLARTGAKRNNFNAFVFAVARCVPKPNPLVGKYNQLPEELKQFFREKDEESRKSEAQAFLLVELPKWLGLVWDPFKMKGQWAAAKRDADARKNATVE